MNKTPMVNFGAWRTKQYACAREIQHIRHRLAIARPLACRRMKSRPASQSRIWIAGVGVRQKLTPRAPAPQISLSQISPVVMTDRTTWQVWVGFNVSLSVSAILFGTIFGYRALVHGQLLFW